MNTIFFNKRYHLRENLWVIPFSCSDIVGIDTEVSYRDRSDADNKVLKNVQDRISIVLFNHGYFLESINFRNMSLSVSKRLGKGVIQNA